MRTFLALVSLTLLINCSGKRIKGPEFVALAVASEEHKRLVPGHLPPQCFDYTIEEVNSADIYEVTVSANVGQLKYFSNSSLSTGSARYVVVANGGWIANTKITGEGAGAKFGFLHGTKPQGRGVIITNSN